MPRSNEASLEYVNADTPREIRIPMLLARILTRVRLTEAGCWEYQGWKTALGYAETDLAGKKWRLHRFMYYALTGEEPAADIAHSCHNRACLNPYHIRPKTHQENLMESSAAKRLQGQGKTHCKRGHPLDGDNLVPYSPFRSCRICERGRNRLKLGWPEHLAFDATIPSIPHGFKLDFETRQIVPSQK
jgi:hypothetical protein